MNCNEIEPIAIIGLGCRFPQAENPEAYWQLLQQQVDAITEVPPDRWDIHAYYDEHPTAPGKMNTRWGGFLEHIDLFDAGFFGIAPREAVMMDPQQRLLLEVTWEALEHAGYAPDNLEGSHTGVFIGICGNDYTQILLSDPVRISAYTGPGGASSIAANRISYVLDLKGPSLVVDTACSSSLVAIHQACQSIRLGECTMALAGGVNLLLIPGLTITFSKAQMMAPDGRCKTFDAQADGYVRGEGCGVVVLKPLSAALKDKDTILALIRGSAVNQDGRSNGLTAPNGIAQQEVIRLALKSAGVAPTQISYIETHGTGTALGDSIEVRALEAVLKEGRDSEQTCLIGSVKTNIGHLEAAAGIAGLIKVVLALKNECIPAHLHVKQVNSYLATGKSHLAVATEPTIWKRGEDPRLAGVSAFGFGGTNCHIIVGEAPSKAPLSLDRDLKEERPWHVFTLSAKSAEALHALAVRYQPYIASPTAAPLTDICYTANTGRTHLPYRFATVVASSDQLYDVLHSFVNGECTDEYLYKQVVSRKKQKVVWVFPDLDTGSVLGSGRHLYATQPLFRASFDTCQKIIQAHLSISLTEYLYGNRARNTSHDAIPLTLAAWFTFEYALSQLWMAWGIRPAAIMGCGIGRYAAACAAKVLSLEDALGLIITLGKLCTTVSHNNLTDPVISQKMGTFISAVCCTPALTPLLAEENNNFFFIHNDIPTLHWFSSLGNPFFLEQGFKSLVEKDYLSFLEVGPRTHLSEMGKDIFPPEKGVAFLSSLSLPAMSEHVNNNDCEILLSSLTYFYTQGIRIDWQAFDRGYQRCKTHLPTYPFERQRYWL